MLYQYHMLQHVRGMITSDTISLTWCVSVCGKTSDKHFSVVLFCPVPYFINMVLFDRDFKVGEKSRPCYKVL